MALVVAASMKRSNTAWSFVIGNWRNAAPPKMTSPTRSPGSSLARSFASDLARSSRVPPASCTSIERDRSSATRRSRPERLERVSNSPPCGRASASRPKPIAAVRRTARTRRATGIDPQAGAREHHGITERRERGGTRPLRVPDEPGRRERQRHQQEERGRHGEDHGTVLSQVAPRMDCRPSMSRPTRSTTGKSSR